MLSSDIWFTVIVTTLLILLLIAGVIITIFLSNRRNTQQEVKMAQMEADYEKELRTTEQEVQEQVLVNVARELHDNIGQLLTVMHMQLEQQKVMAPDLIGILKPMNDTLTQTIQEVRRVGRSLNSDLLDTNGLINTIQHEVERLQQLNKFKVHWEFDAEPVLTKDQKVITFRIFQEIINNVLKHSGATNIHIRLTGKDAFTLSVKDDGKGFDLDEMMLSSKGSGLKNMMKRAELAKLKCTISTAKNKGAIFTPERTT
jgi:signal transduction histidine kinase